MEGRVKETVSMEQQVPAEESQNSFDNLKDRSTHYLKTSIINV
jgi:hypothetical protein